MLNLWKKNSKKFANDKNYRKVRDHCHYTGKCRGAAHSMCNLKFNVPNEIPVTFHNGSNYDYHFIIKELVNEFEGQFGCLGENTEKYKTFSVPIEKEVTKVDKDSNESATTISYKIKFIDSARFMASSLSNLVGNIAEEIHKIKCKDCDCFLEYESVTGNLIKCKCLSGNKDYLNKLDENFKKQFKNIFQFSDNDIHKFIFLLRKGVYPHEYIDEWEPFNGTILPEKEEFYSNLNMEDITDTDYMHGKRVCKDFQIKNSGEYHDFYLKSDVLLLVCVFKNFRKMCLKIYHLDPVKFLSSPGLAWQAALKKNEVKLELLTDIDMQLMVEKGIRQRICQCQKYDNSSLWKN